MTDLFMEINALLRQQTMDYNSVCEFARFTRVAVSRWNLQVQFNDI